MLQENNSGVLEKCFSLEYFQTVLFIMFSKISGYNLHNAHRDQQYF